MPEDPTQTEISSPAPRRRRRLLWVFLLLALGFLVLGPPLAFWGGTYLFLNTPLGPKLLNKGGRVTLDWKGGHSWIPGEVTVRGFSLEGVTPKGRWRLEVDRAELRHQIKPFFERAFIADNIQAKGATFAWTSFEEPIELPPRRARKRPGWHLGFPNINIDGVRRLAFDETEVDAAVKPGQASLALDIQIRGPFSAPRMSLEIADAVIDRSGEALGRLEKLNLSGRLDPFEPKKHRGAAALRFASGEVALRSEAWNLSNLSNFFRGLPVHLEGRGELDAWLEIDRGVLEPASSVDVRGGTFEIDYLNYRAQGSGALSLKGDESQRTSRLQVTLDTYTFGHIGATPHVEGQSLLLIGSGPPLDLANPEPQFVAEIKIPKAQVPNFSAFNDALPQGVPIQLYSGRGEMDLELRLDPQEMEVSGQVALRGDGIAAEVDGQIVTGDLQMSARLEEGDIDTRRFSLGEARLNIDRVEADGLRDWWARLEISDGEVTLGQPLALAARTSAVLSDARPMAALLLDDRRRIKWLNRVLDEKKVRASADLRFDESALSITALDVTSGRRLHGRGELLLAQKEITGLLLVEFGPLAAGAELLPGGEKNYKLRRARDWFLTRRAAEAARLSGR